MPGRKSRPSTAIKDQAETIKQQVERRGEEFGRRAEAVIDALGVAVDRIQDLSVTAGRRASRRGRAATQRSAEAAREALDQARHTIRQVPDWDQVADLARKTSDRLMPERAKQRRRAERRRRMRLAASGVGLAGLGAAVLAWLGSGRRSTVARTGETTGMGDRASATTTGTAATGTAATGLSAANAPASSTSSIPSNPGSTTPTTEEIDATRQPTSSGNGHTGPGQEG